MFCNVFLKLSQLFIYLNTLFHDILVVTLYLFTLVSFILTNALLLETCFWPFLLLLQYYSEYPCDETYLYCIFS